MNIFSVRNEVNLGPAVVLQRLSVFLCVAARYMSDGDYCSQIQALQYVV